LFITSLFCSRRRARPAGVEAGGQKEEIRYEKKSSDFVNNLFNQTTGQ